MQYSERQLAIVKERILQCEKPAPLPPAEWHAKSQDWKVERYSADADWACKKIYEHMQAHLEDDSKLDERGMYNAIREEFFNLALSANQMSWALNTARAFVGLEPIDPMELFEDSDA